MMERIPQQRPLPCFGLEFDLLPDQCQSCLHRAPCSLRSSTRAGRVPLSRASVSIPSPQGDAHVDERNLAASELELYHRAILRRDGPKLDYEGSARLVDTAQVLQVEPGLLILSVLLTHKAMSPDRPFRTEMLFGPWAAKALTAHRSECATRYGSFDAYSLAKITHLSPDHDIVQRLADSENLAARWAIGAALNGTSMTGLYSERELALDPWWLATEPSYKKWVEEDEEAPALEISRHRQRALKLCVKSRGLPAVIKARNTVAKTQLVSQATRLNLDPDKVLVAPIIRRPDRVWRGLAFARATLDAVTVLRDSG